MRDKYRLQEQKYGLKSDRLEDEDEFSDRVLRDKYELQDEKLRTKMDKFRAKQRLQEGDFEGKQRLQREKFRAKQRLQDKKFGLAEDRLEDEEIRYRMEDLDIEPIKQRSTTSQGRELMLEDETSEESIDDVLRDIERDEVDREEQARIDADWSREPIDEETAGDILRQEGIRLSPRAERRPVVRNIPEPGRPVTRPEELPIGIRKPEYLPEPPVVDDDRDIIIREPGEDEWDFSMRQREVQREREGILNASYAKERQNFDVRRLENNNLRRQFNENPTVFRENIVNASFRPRVVAILDSFDNAQNPK